ncbi:Gfo/Idh/MocA family protein [Halalkalibacter flavus]|uniref:Gfo/Idh/MocA family protein n=1 Tax=Halalkalibacter flavus TaxID=3090668 RepID=UPI002FC69508
MKPFKVGLLGCGDISDIYIHVCETLDIIEITACASRNIENANRKAEDYNIPKACTIDELIADPELDIILNLTIPEVHAKYNLAALEAGKHVYTEKPLAANLEDAKKIMELAKEKGLRVGCAPDTFLGGRLQTARKVMDEGLIGEIVGASAFVGHRGPELFHPNPDFFYKPGGGPLLDIGPYYMTALISLLGPISSCCGYARKTFEERTIQTESRLGESIDVEVPTHISGNLQFENGTVATIMASFDVWDSELPRMEIYGSKGTLLIPDVDPLDGPNLFGGPLLVRTSETSRWRTLPRSESPKTWEEVQLTHGFNEDSRGLGLADMAYAIRDHRPERASAEMAYHSLEAMIGLLESSSKGKFYTLNSTCARPSPLPVNFPFSEKS